MKSSEFNAPLERAEVVAMIEKCYGALKVMARKYYRDRDNVLDLVQDTVCKVLVSESLGGVRCKSDLLGLCALAMRSVRYNDLRDSSNMTLVYTSAEDDYGSSAPIYDAFSDSEVEAIRGLSLESAVIDAALAKAEGYTESEIADRQGVCLNTVKSRVRIGRESLRRKMKV